MKITSLTCFLFFVLVNLTVTTAFAEIEKMETVRAQITPQISKQLAQNGFTLGDPVFLRVFKQEKIVEVWMRKQGKKKYDIFKKYPICVFSGTLGPKLEQGDMQSPEGFYDVTVERLHPESRFHLAFNLGYPNAFDQARGRTGDFLMIHGGCESEGCFAMTDTGMEELYILAEAALMAGQPEIDVHIFPFYMTTKNFRFHAKSTWLPFWYSLKPAYDMFQARRIPPEIDMQNGHYNIKNVQMLYNE